MSKILKFPDAQPSEPAAQPERRRMYDDAFEDMIAVLEHYSHKDASDAAAGVMIALLCTQSPDLQTGLDTVTKFGGYARQQLHNYFAEKDGPVA